MTDEVTREEQVELLQTFIAGRERALKANYEELLGSGRAVVERQLTVFRAILSHLRTPRVEAGDGVTYRIEPSFPPNVDQFDIVDSNGVTIAWRLNTEQAQGVIDALSRRPSEAVDTTRPAPSRRLTEAEREVVEAGAAMYDRQAQALQSEGYEQASATVYRKAATLRALASENGAAVGAWQPIDTAPKDGRGIIGWQEGWTEGSEVHWCGDEHDGGWYLANNHPSDSWGPGAFPLTRWQPLPPSPPEGGRT